MSQPPIPLDEIEPCCFIGEAGDERPTCMLEAEWQIDGPGADDQTFACTSHVGDLLSDAPVHVVIPVLKARDV